jgi:hypothetical protein
MSNANEPAYPEIKTDAAYDGDGRGVPYSNVYSVGGLTKRERAAIDLRVPMSGDDDIDAMIRAANRKDFAAMAMQGYIAGQYAGSYDTATIAKMSATKADALLAELERTA